MSVLCLGSAFSLCQWLLIKSRLRPFQERLLRQNLASKLSAAHWSDVSLLRTTIQKSYDYTDVMYLSDRLDLDRIRMLRVTCFTYYSYSCMCIYVYIDITHTYISYRIASRTYIIIYMYNTFIYIFIYIYIYIYAHNI